MINTILFDLGGVLVETNDFPIRTDWHPESVSLDEMRTTWLESTIAHAFEKGQLSAQEFAEQYIAEHQLAVSPDEFLESFRLWPKGVYPGVHEFLVNLRRHFKIALFSNTNELHWDRLMHEMELDNLFDSLFCIPIDGSCKTGSCGIQSRCSRNEQSAGTDSLPG